MGVLKSPPKTLDAATVAAVEVGNKSEPFRTLEAMLNIVDRGQAFMLIQKKENREYKNYGELVGFRNRVNKKRWDVLVPGVKDQLNEGDVFRVRRVLGVVLIKGGNHKLAVQLAQKPGSSFFTNFKKV